MLLYDMNFSIFSPLEQFDIYGFIWNDTYVLFVVHLVLLALQIFNIVIPILIIIIIGNIYFLLLIFLLVSFDSWRRPELRKLYIGKVVAIENHYREYYREYYEEGYIREHPSVDHYFDMLILLTVIQYLDSWCGGQGHLLRLLGAIWNTYVIRVVEILILLLQEYYFFIKQLLHWFSSLKNKLSQWAIYLENFLSDEFLIECYYLREDLIVHFHFRMEELLWEYYYLRKRFLTQLLQFSYLKKSNKSSISIILLLFFKSDIVINYTNVAIMLASFVIGLTSFALNWDHPILFSWGVLAISYACLPSLESAVWVVFFLFRIILFYKVGKVLGSFECVQLLITPYLSAWCYQIIFFIYLFHSRIRSLCFIQQTIQLWWKTTTQLWWKFFWKVTLNLDCK